MPLGRQGNKVNGTHDLELKASALPLLNLQGTPQQVGYVHGLRAGKLIARNLEVYFHRFQHEAGLPPEEVLRRAAWWWQKLQRIDPEYAAIVAGIAEGSGLPLLQIVALNVRYELFYSEFSRQGRGTAACTTFAVLPDRTASGHLLMGENWDWFPGVEGLWLRLQTPGQTILAFTEAGIAGPKIGINSHNLGLCLAGLLSQWDRWDGEGTPVHVICFRVLNCPTLEEAVHQLENSAMPCSASFLVGQAHAEGQGVAVNVEKAPRGTVHWKRQDGLLVHTNHFLAPDTLGALETLGEERVSTYLRQARMEELLGGGGPRLDEQMLNHMLADHQGFPDSICRHPNPALPPHARYATVLSVVMDLHAGKLSHTVGPPCWGARSTVSLATD